MAAKGPLEFNAVALVCRLGSPLLARLKNGRSTLRSGSATGCPDCPPRLPLPLQLPFPFALMTARVFLAAPEVGAIPGRQDWGNIS